MMTIIGPPFAWTMIVRLGAESANYEKKTQFTLKAGRTQSFGQIVTVLPFLV